MEPVFAYVPIINQMLTILSNATTINGIPRWVIEMPDGSVLRGEDGEPIVLEQGDFPPGLDPAEAVAVMGKLVQVKVDTESLLKELDVLYARLDAVMPAPVSTGVSGASAAAWQVRQLIQQAQESLRQPVDNHAAAVKEIVQMWHSWMRALDMPVYFFAASGHRSDKRNVQGLIEFDPAHLTDAISVTQELDTPEEQTVRIQQGLELRQSGAITWRQFFEEYLRTPDAREAEIDMYVQMVLDQVMTGAATQPGSVIQMVADGVRGIVHYELIKMSDNYALTVAEDIAAKAMQGPMQPRQPGMEGQPNVAEAAGVSEPGMGAPMTLEDTLGSNVPGGNAPVGVAGG
jgi:hypothetical protein